MANKAYSDTVQRLTQLSSEAKVDGRLEDMMALDLAVDAVRKQAPTMPHKLLMKNRGGWRQFACPFCNQYVEYREHHCKCGQRLDWSVLGYERIR